MEMFTKYTDTDNQPYAEAASFSVGQFFEEHLNNKRVVRIPGFQRDYVWGPTEIATLLSDVEQQWLANTSERPQYHPLGTICCARHNSDLLSVVDGQQRITTLFLTIAAGANLLSETNADEEATALRELIYHLKEPRFSEAEERLVLEVNHLPARKFLLAVASGTDIADAHRTVAPYELAYHEIKKWLAEACHRHSKSSSFTFTETLCDFLEFLLRRVSFVVETVPDWDAARVFALRNTRGVTLTELDNLKADLYGMLEQSDYQEFFEVWEDMRDLQHEAGLSNSDRFLRLAVHSRVKPVRDPRTARNAVVRYAKDHGALTAVINILTRTARDYKRMLDGYNLAAGESIGSAALRGLQNANLLKPYKQLHATYLAAADLNSAARFEELARVLADFTDFAKLALFPTDWEEAAKDWPAYARQGDIDAIADNINNIKQQHADAFAEGVMRLTMDGGNTEFVRRILGRASVAMSNWGDYRNMKAFWDPELEFPRRKHADDSKGWEIEHIRPQSRLGELDPEDWMGRTAITCLGNLTLLEHRLNAGARDKSYDEKKSYYKASRNLLTNFIVQPPDGNYTQRGEAWLRGVRYWETWTDADIKDRHIALFGLLAEIYGMERLIGMTEDTWRQRVITLWGPENAPTKLFSTKHIPQITPEGAFRALEYLAQKDNGATKTEIEEGLKAADRQVGYMLSALEGLELVEKDKEGVWALTDMGLTYCQVSEDEKHHIVRSAILRSPTYRVVVGADSEEEAEQALTQLVDRNGKRIGAATADRRMGSIPSWLVKYYPDPEKLPDWIRRAAGSDS